MINRLMGFGIAIGFCFGWAPKTEQSRQIGRTQISSGGAKKRPLPARRKRDTEKQVFLPLIGTLFACAMLRYLRMQTVDSTSKQ